MGSPALGWWINSVPPEDAAVYPTHGFGSFCSATQSEASSSTIGRERLVNPVLTLAEDRYVSELLAGLDAFPAYYAHMGPANAAGPSGPDLMPPRRADAGELRRRIEAGEWVVDLRARRAFAAGHVSGTLSFDLDGSFDLARDVAEGGFTVEKGMMRICEAPGLGLRVPGSATRDS